jgi:hypothetical protein
MQTKEGAGAFEHAVVAYSPIAGDGGRLRDKRSRRAYSGVDTPSIVELGGIRSVSITISANRHASKIRRVVNTSHAFAAHQTRSEDRLGAWNSSTPAIQLDTGLQLDCCGRSWKVTFKAHGVHLVVTVR